MIVFHQIVFLSSYFFILNLQPVKIGNKSGCILASMEMMAAGFMVEIIADFPDRKEVFVGLYPYHLVMLPKMVGYMQNYPTMP